MAESLSHDALWQRHGEADAWRTYVQLATDAWAGSGGFAAPHDAEGTQRDTTLPSGWRSYLVQHPQEDAAKYAWRVRNAVYPPVPRIVGETLLAFLFARGPTRDGTARLLDGWREDADGAGTSLDGFLKRLAAHALLFPLGLVLIDAPGEKYESQAEAAEAGWAPYVQLVHPALLFDWRLRADGRFSAVKLVDQIAEGGIADRTTTWTRARIYEQDDRGIAVRIYRQDKTGEAASLVAERRLATPLLPLVPCRLAEPIVPDALAGPATMRQVVEDARGLFNDLSLLQEHLAAQCFALLTYQQERTEQAGPLVVGSNNALTYPMGCERPDFISPPEATAATLFRAIEERVRRIYRMMRLEFVLNDAQQAPASGVARQYEFQATNRALSAWAAVLRECERQIAYHVFSFYGRADAAKLSAAYTVAWPDDFDVRDLDAEVRRTQEAMLLPLDSVTRAALLRTLRDDLVDLDADQRAVSDAELNAAATATAEPTAVLPPAA